MVKGQKGIYFFGCGGNDDATAREGESARGGATWKKRERGDGSAIWFGPIGWKRDPRKARRRRTPKGIKFFFDDGKQL